MGCLSRSARRLQAKSLSQHSAAREERERAPALLIRFLVQPAVDRRNRAQPDEASVLAEACWPPPPVLDMGMGGPDEDRLAAEELIAPRFPVPSPELHVVADAVERAAPDPAQLDPKRQVEPDDGVRRVDDLLAQFRVVVAVDHPAAGGGRHCSADPGAELLRRWLAPVWTVVERIELDVGQVESARQLCGEGRLASARGALDNDLPGSTRIRVRDADGCVHGADAATSGRFCNTLSVDSQAIPECRADSHLLG